MGPETESYGPEGPQTLNTNLCPEEGQYGIDSLDIRNEFSSQGVKNSVPPVALHVDEIISMRERIEELERQATANPSLDDSREGANLRPAAMPKLLEYKRMEDCLYRHRKEWEASSRGDDWMLAANPRWDFDNHLKPDVVREFIPAPGYKRPDPFDKAHQCGDGFEGEDGCDEFDCTIDFESRRQRVRKGFEWELDRLYLMEELESRRRARKEKKKQPDVHTGTEQADQQDPPPHTVEKSFVLPTLPEPRINRVDWHVFRRLTMTKATARMLDILMGEPIVQDSMPRYGTWYGFSGLSPRKPKRVQGNVSFTAKKPEEAPLPERVRIYSDTLMKIMAKILGSDGRSLENIGDTPMVFLRPFKALVYCEEQLRQGCAALEKKFTVSSDTLVEDLGEEGCLSASKSQGKDANIDQGEKVSSDPRSTTGECYVDDADDVDHDDHDDHGDDENGDENEESPEPDDDTNSLTTLKHLRCLLQFFDEDIIPKRAYLEQPQSRKVFFSDLWHLFRPGMEVIGNDGRQAYRVLQVKSARHRVVPTWQRFRQSSDNDGKRSQAPFSLDCVYIDFDGKNLGPVSKVFEFKRFEGQRDITSLEVYPLKFYSANRADYGDEEWKEIESLSPSERSARYRQKLIARGQRFLEVANVKHMYYAGPTLGVRDEVESQVVIDFETAFAVDIEQQDWKPKLEHLVGQFSSEDEEEEVENCAASCCEYDQVHDDNYVDDKQRTDYINSLLPKSEGEEEKSLLAIIPRPLKDLQSGTNSRALVVPQEELVIMSYRVFGFVLRTRKWAKLDLSYLTNVHQQESQAVDGKDTKSGKGNTVFDRLVLEENHKGMIVSLVSQHFRDKGSTANQKTQVDIVRGKGKGLILLLHGDPGVGKTSTAEGVAELFQKPLFQITCGDLGTTAKEVEKALETNFALANRWDCILLLDEADVFLSQRTKEDFQRNGLVAVFLRVMEYYAGILFLTTNRVGDFDEAFTSRIHVSLYYPALDRKKTVNVFKLNLELIKERFRLKGRRIDIDEFDIGDFASSHFKSNPNARWNGRQIRNACQTALALAEFEAQGNSHTAVESPDAVVTLSVSHFKIVRDAYIEFTKYIDKLYGTNASKRAQEDRLRTTWANHSHNIPATQGVDQQAHFAQMARGQPPSSPQYASGHFSNPDVPPAMHNRVKPPPQIHPYYEYSNVPPEVSYSYHNPAMTQERPISTAGRRPHDHNVPATAPEPHSDHYRYHLSPQSQDQRPPPPGAPSWLDRDVERMYEGANVQGHRPEPSHTFTPAMRGDARLI